MDYKTSAILLNNVQKVQVLSTEQNAAQYVAKNKIFHWHEHQMQVLQYVLG